MIVKKNEKPKILLMHEALSRRLPQDHPKQSEVMVNLARRRAGYIGESSLGYYLKYLSSEKYHIFHGLRLHDGVHHFQIDLLILTKQFILIIEVKNMAGILQFDPVFNQLIRLQDEKEESFQDPLLQVNRHKYQLLSWITLNKLPTLPIETIVLSSSSNTTIKALSNQHYISQTVIHAEKLLSKISSIEQKFSSMVITEKELKKLSRLLLKKNEDSEPNILEQYELSQSDLLAGVFCPECSYLPMDRIHGNWYCPQCKQHSKLAHVKALVDYSLLISKDITNQQVRDFLKIDSISTAKRLMRSLNLSHTGQNKGRTYNLSRLS